MIGDKLKIDLWTLNQSFRPLIRLTSQTLPKESHALSFKLAKVMRAAQKEQDSLNDSLADLMRKCGFEPGQQNIDTQKIEDFNLQSKLFMKASTCEIWGEPIKWSELQDHVE